MTHVAPCVRYKGKARAMPTVPNQPSEALAHFMLELAKTVLTKAGGSSATSLFTQASAAHPGGATHRALHVCAFQIGLYALGLHNCVSPNWLSRTYSSHVSWIMGRSRCQVVSIVSYCFLMFPFFPFPFFFFGVFLFIFVFLFFLFFSYLFLFVRIFPNFPQVFFHFSPFSPYFFLFFRR